MNASPLLTLFVFLCGHLLAVSAAETSRATRWTSARGEWTDAARWSGGLPDALSRAAISGQSEVRLPALRQPAGVGALAIGALPGDKVRLLIAGGQLVCRRHFRLNPGDDTDDTDALSFHDAERCIADHLSLSWGTDEVLSITGLSDAITVQWCLISEALNRQQHGYASIAAGERVTWHHNLFAHHISRVPRFAGIVRADFRNNFLYNWGHTAGYGQFERVNHVANYLQPGPSTTQRPPLIHCGDEVVGEASFFLDGNILYGSEAVSRDNWLGVGFDLSVRAARPFPAPPILTTSAEAAYEQVLSQAGAFPAQRDATDARVVREVRAGTGRVIKTVSEVEK